MYKEISAEKMIKSLCETYIDSKTFCFFLGAGASRNSNIASGKELAKRWFEEWLLIEPFKAKEFKAKVNLTDDDYGTYYSKIYDGRFGNNRELEAKEQLHQEIMQGIPSAGYYFLSKILTETRNNLTITTNFDYLVEDAIHLFTQKRAFSLADESLTKHIKESLRYPIITKLHGDTLARPLSASKDLERFEAQWLESLSVLLRNYSSIVVVGHSGNDDDVEKFFEEYAKDKTIYWCYWHESKPSERLRNLLEKVNDGYFIPIKGFDEIMFALANKLFDTIKEFSFPYLSSNLNINFKNDIKNLVKRLNNIFYKTLPEGNAYSSIMKKMEKSQKYLFHEIESPTCYDEHVAKFEQAINNANMLAEDKEFDSAIDQFNSALESFVPIDKYDNRLYASGVLGLSVALSIRGSIEDIKKAIFVLEDTIEKMGKEISNSEFEEDEFIELYKPLKDELIFFIICLYNLLYEKTEDKYYFHKLHRYSLMIDELSHYYNYINNFLAFSYYCLEDWEKCIKHAKEWIALSKKPLTKLEESPISVPVMMATSTYNSVDNMNYVLAVAYTEIGKLEDAEKYLEGLIKTNFFGKNILVVTHLYILKILLGKIEDVNEIFDIIKSDFTFYLAGISYLIHEKYDCAISMLNSINKPDELDKALLALAQYKMGKLDEKLLQETFDLLSISEKANENFSKIVLAKISFELQLVKNIDILYNKVIFKFNYKTAHHNASKKRYDQPIKSYYDTIGKIESLLCDLWQVDYILHVKNVDKNDVIEHAVGILNNLEQQYPKLSIIKEKKLYLEGRL